MTAFVEPTRHRISIDDFVRMGDAGIFEPGAHDVLLAIEVAGTSPRFDLETESRVYAMHGVREYWVVEAARRRLHLCRAPMPAEGRWADARTLDAPFRVSPVALPALAVSSDDLWPPSIPSS